MVYEQDQGFAAFLDAAASHRILAHSEELELARRWRNDGDNDARHQLFLHNIRLVISIARKFTGRGLPLEDLIQAGLIGLDRATRKYDPEKGFKCSTYFSWWIRQSTQRAVAAEGRTIRVPNQVATRKLQIDTLLKDEPGLSYVELAKRLECTPAQVGQAVRTAEVVASLDQEALDDEQSLFNTLPNAFADDPTDQGGYPELDDALRKLPLLQRRVVELLHGVGSEAEGGERTLGEVADLLGTTVSVVQAAKREAFTVLRNLI